MQKNNDQQEFHSIAILGAGALGTVFGTRLAISGCNVTLISTRKEYRESVALRGTTIEDNTHKQTVSNINVVGHLSEAPAPDIIFLLVKACDTESAMISACSFIPEKCIVITLQNGLGNVETIAKYIPLNSILAGITYIGATYIGNGYVKYSGKGKTIIGEFNGHSTFRLKMIQNILEKANFLCEITKDLQDTLWSKFLVNLAINPLAALTRQKNGALANSDHAVALIDSILSEAKLIAEKEKIQIPKNLLKKTLSIAHLTHDNTASMLQDILHKRKTEIHQLNGIIVSKAKNLGIDVPVNKAIVELISLLEQSSSLEQIV